MYVEIEKNGFAWHRQQSNGIRMRFGGTRIYMRHTMRILKDQFHGTEKCGSIQFGIADASSWQFTRRTHHPLPFFLANWTLSYYPVWIYAQTVRRSVSKLLSSHDSYSPAHEGNTSQSEHPGDRVSVFGTELEPWFAVFYCFSVTHDFMTHVMIIPQPASLTATYMILMRTKHVARHSRIGRMHVISFVSNRVHCSIGV